MKILLILAALSMPAIFADKCSFDMGGGDSAVPSIVQQ